MVQGWWESRRWVTIEVVGSRGGRGLGWWGSRGHWVLGVVGSRE